jgi:hypothetical protein
VAHSLEPAAPWEQLGITEAAYRERERIASQIAANQGPGLAEEVHAIREETKDLPALDASHDSKPTKPERKTITVDLTDEPQVYARIKQLAEADDRTLAMWLKRYLRKEHGAAVTK